MNTQTSFYENTKDNTTLTHSSQVDWFGSRESDPVNEPETGSPWQFYVVTTPAAGSQILAFVLPFLCHFIFGNCVEPAGAPTPQSPLNPLPHSSQQ